MVEQAPPAGGSNVDAPTNDPKGKKAAEEPTIQPIRLPSQDEIMAQDIFNNCAVRAAVSGVMGGGMGVLMGALFGGLDAPIEGLRFRDSVWVMVKSTGSRSLSMAKTFAVMGALFSGAECMVEKARAKHDGVNTALAGCITGGILSAQAGPQAACVGCAGFAAFSVLIEKVLDRH